ncbi:MAG TPA: ATP-binding protein, partial [Thermoanaerobaculia bacterium]|nr:ATP-binding protein [Thermoanaerobaculia bacterium]
MRIERLRIDGFGALSGIDLEWPEGKLLLVVDPNETGKTTLCESIVVGLYGLPRGRVVAARTREIRRPRGGGKLAVALDVAREGDSRLSVERDLENGTLRVVDRDRGVDVTRDFLRGGGRDVFGETVTSLTEPLFRTTAYVGQNVLHKDELDSTLTVELARIADSG